MNLIKSNLPKIFGWFFIALIFYIFTAVILFSFSAITISKNITIPIFPIDKYQKFFYASTIRNVWQYQSDCVELDHELIYKPKFGACKFNNLEFQSILNFDNYGRKMPNRKTVTSDNGIAIIGDSFTMGWGVGDNETFSNILQKLTNKSVYNLGVSSYGTDREIKRLIQTNLISKVDTIIIQYCENDLTENQAINDTIKFNLEKEKFIRLFNGQENTSWNSKTQIVWDFFKFSTLEPLRMGKSLLGGKVNQIDFKLHQTSLNDVLRKYQLQLKDKKIVIFYLNDHNINFRNFNVNKIESLNISSIDFQLAILNKNDYFKIDDHLNVIGHDKIGNALFNYLKNNE